MYSDKENINILTRLLVEYGVGHVVVCPGSRNAPIVHNFNECPEIECHPVTDERSASFVALGMAEALQELVAVCVTSGSALLNTLPGVAEASYRKQGIIVISADRPAAWIGQLDGQTMPQPGAMGTFVAKSVSLPECKDDIERWHCRRLVCEAIMAREATGDSVHINVPITEPLFNFTEEQLPVVAPIESLYWGDDDDETILREAVLKAERPMVVVGQCWKNAVTEEILDTLREKMVVLAEQLSVDTPSPALDEVFGHMANIEDYKPDFLLYIGRTTISKKLRQFLRKLDDCTVVMLNYLSDIEDVSQHARYVLVGGMDAVLCDIASFIVSPNTDFQNRWNTLFSKAEETIGNASLSLEADAVRLFEQRMNVGDNVYYANSSAVRLAAKYAKHFVYCNRGLNGIEGSLSTAVGASLVTDENVYCVIGDLSFFYDQNALWNQQIKGNLRILLLNNGGGKIFEQLPGLSKSPAMKEYVQASHPTTAVGACHQYGISRKAVSKVADLEAAMQWLTEDDSQTPRLLEILDM